MRYLLFVNLLFCVACSSPYKTLQVSTGDVSCINKFKPIFTSVLYNTQVNVVGKHLSGLLLIKTMPDSSIRMVFSNEMGFKFFDFGFSRAGEFKVYAIIKQMNKKAVVETLRKDFEMVMMRNLSSGDGQIKKANGQTYFLFRDGKETNSYITGDGCKELLRIEKASGRKIKVQAIMQNYLNGVPDSIGITHKNFNFNIGLKRLER